MKVTRHAKKRWRERCPELNIETEFARARRRMGKKLRRIVARRSPKHLHYCDTVYKGRYMVTTPEWIVFVVTPPEKIITVLDLRTEKQRPAGWEEA